MREIIIKHFFNYEFVYIFLFCSIVFLLISMFVKQQKIKKISVSLISIFFALFLSELGLSFFMPLPQTTSKRQINTSQDINKIKKIKHLKFYSNNKTYEFHDRDVDIDCSSFSLIYKNEYKLCLDNFRITQCNQSSNEVYVFLGCSYTFGYGLNEEETLPYYFSKLYDFNKNVINCGMAAKSTNTTLSILNNELFLPLIKNKNAEIKNFVYTFIYDHIFRNFNYEDEHYRIDGYLHENGKCFIPTAIRKIKYIFARSYIFTKVFVSLIDEYFKQYYEEYMIESLKKINKIIENKYNSKLTIIVYPECCNEKIRNKLKETNLDLIFLPEYFDDIGVYKIKYDGHPTAKANEEIAQILYNHINEKYKTN